MLRGGRSIRAESGLRRRSRPRGRAGGFGRRGDDGQTHEPGRVPSASRDDARSWSAWADSTTAPSRTRRTRSPGWTETETCQKGSSSESMSQDVPSRRSARPRLAAKRSIIPGVGRPSSNTASSSTRSERGTTRRHRAPGCDRLASRHQVELAERRSTTGVARRHQRRARGPIASIASSSGTASLAASIQVRAAIPPSPSRRVAAGSPRGTRLLGGHDALGELDPVGLLDRLVGERRRRSRVEIDPAAVASLGHSASPTSPSMSRAASTSTTRRALRSEPSIREAARTLRCARQLAPLGQVVG